MAGRPAESLDFIINHVILPPKLPQEADDSKTSQTAERHLLRLLSSEASFYRLRNQESARGSTPEFREAWRVTEMMLSRCATVISAKYLSPELLERLFSDLTVQGVSLLGSHRILGLVC